MTRRFSAMLPLVAACALTATLSACVIAPEPAYYRQGPVVYAAPPPPQSEYMGPPPAAGYVWISGFWAWQLGRHVWMAGHWDAPRPGYRWVPYAWHQDGRGWRLREGRWDRY